MNVTQEAPLPRRLSIEELLRRARAGDDHALEKLFQHARKQLEGWASSKKYRLQRGENRPSDMAQEAAMRAHKGFGAFRGSSEPQWNAWLKEILLNHIKQVLRAEGRKKRQVLDLVPLDSTESREVRNQDRSPSQQIAQQEDWYRLLANLARLPDAQKDAIYLCHLDDRPVAQVAAQMSRTRESVSSLIQRGIRTLRSQMAGGPEDPSSEETGWNGAARALLEYLERRDRGEILDPETFAAQHPECVDELRVMFHWIERLRALRPPPPA